MPPAGYRTLTIRDDVTELLGRAKVLFHKSQIQLLLEALSEYINRHYEYGSAVLSGTVPDPVSVAWSAGVFEGLRVAFPHPSPTMKVALEVLSPDKDLLERLEDTWGGSLYEEKAHSSEEDGISWVWGLQPEKANRFLEAILPYIKGSKSRLVKTHLAGSEPESSITSRDSEAGLSSSSAESLQ